MEFNFRHVRFPIYYIIDQWSKIKKKTNQPITSPAFISNCSSRSPVNCYCVEVLFFFALSFFFYIQTAFRNLCIRFRALKMALLFRLVLWTLFCSSLFFLYKYSRIDMFCLLCNNQQNSIQFCFFFSVVTCSTLHLEILGKENVITSTENIPTKDIIIFMPFYPCR